MASIISLVFIIVIIKFVIKASRSGQDSHPIQKRASYVDNSNFEVNKPAKGTPKTTGVSREMRGGTTGSADINRNSEGKSFRAMEDREHDWLARQLAYEKSAKYRMSEMFDIRKAHADNCAAEKNRQLHERNCDVDGIDTASYR